MRKVCSGCPHLDRPERATSVSDIEVRKQGRMEWAARFPWPEHVSSINFPGPRWATHKYRYAWTRSRAIAKAERLLAELLEPERQWEPAR